MRRPPVLLALLVVVATLARAWVHPILRGLPDPSRPTSTFGIAAPFGDDLKGSSDAFLTLQARSLLREGLAATGGIPLFNVEKAAPEEFFYYDHHPPGVALATALAIRLFGDSEGVARSVALLFATATLIAIAWFARGAAGDGAAALAVVAMGALPIGLYWATHLDYFVPTIAACALFFTLALREPQGTKGRATTVFAALALVAAMSLDLLAALAAAAASFELLLRRPRRWRAIVGWPLLAAACAFGWSCWAKAQLGRHGHGDGTDRLGYLLVSIAPSIAGGPGIAWSDFLAAIEHHLRDLVTPLGELLLVAGAILALGPRRREPIAGLWRASALLALGAGVIPRLHSYYHVYFQLYWIVPLAASAALVAAAARRKLVVAGIALALIAAGWLALPESTIAPERPSSHRLGRDFAERAPAPARAIALPSDSTFNEFVPDYYAGHVVLRLPPGDPTRHGIRDKLEKLGLRGADDPWLAKDPQWPGRGGWEPLR